MKLLQEYVFTFWLLMGISTGNVIVRKARSSADALDTKDGLRLQLDDVTEAVKKLQEEFESEDHHRRRNTLIKGVSLDEGDEKSGAQEEKRNFSMNNMFKGTALGEKLLEAGVKLLTRELDKRVKDKEESKDSDASTKQSDQGRLEKRVNPAAAQMGAKAGEKAVDMGAKLAEKQMETMEKQKGKVDKFLGQEIKLDITGDKGWQTDDMFIPPGYHMDAKVVPETKLAPAVQGQQPFTFPFGAGGLIMNGCFGSGYQPGDRCYDATWATTKCLDLIPGATFIGVGFDGRGDYSPESSRMDLVQRACSRKQRYNGKMIPDSMKLLGVYDTNANMQVFYSRTEYQKYLEQQSGVSGSGFGFYAGVKNAWGSSTTAGTQKYLAVFDIDVDRYEIFMDVVTPDNLNIGFLREFMNLPTSYYAPGAALKFQDFIQRFGTHYIKAGRFGGQLEIRKSMDASEISSKSEFSQVMEFEFKSFFASAGARKSDREGERSRSQTKTSSTSMSIQGGSQDIAAVISDVYAPTFKAEFKEWLRSIPQFPKAFKFTISPITDLLNFRSSDLFPAEAASFGCEAHRAKLKKDRQTNRYYYNATVNGTIVKEFCDYLSREALEYAIRQRRSSLKRAIDVYMEEGSISVSDMSLPPGTPGCQTQNYKYQMKAGRPTWNEITTHQAAFKAIFKMDSDLTGSYHGMVKIPSRLECIVRYIGGEWVVSKDYDKFDFFSGCNRGGSGQVDSDKHYICIYGLLLKYDERMGALNLDEHGYNISKQTFPTLDTNLIGGEIGRVEWPADHIFQMREVVGYLPCNVKWSNALRFDPTGEGRCLHFTASTKGTVFVIFSVIPKDKDTWYYVQISPYGVGIFKSQTLKVSSLDVDAIGLGDEILYQPYFVCVKQEPDATIIEYGKSQGTTEKGEIFLSLIDKEKPVLHVRFYAFGNGEDALEVTNAHVLKRSLTTAECKGDTSKDPDTSMCVQKCHELCNPVKGCRSTSTGEPLATDCNACFYFKRVDTGECVKTCPEGFKERDATCVPKGCQKNPCMNGGTCKDLGDEKYSCQCTSDYRGDHCEIAAHPCDPNPCKNDGTCAEDPKRAGHFLCSCASEFGGETCEIDKCPDDWNEFEDVCYKFAESEGEVSFTEARSICDELNAEVLVINSKQEDQFVANLIGRDHYVWLGMHMRPGGLDSSWELINGEEPSFNKISSRANNHYMSRHHYSSYHSSVCAVLAPYEWVPIPCSSEAFVACKRPISR